MIAATKEKLKELDSVFHLIKDIIIISDSGKKLLDANNAFFEFFNQFKTLEDFNKNHNCICEFFEKIDKEGYIYKDENINDENWLEHIFNAEGKVLKAKVIKNTNEFMFNIRVSVLNKEKHKYIISMSDITAVEQKNILLNQIIENKQELNKLKKDYAYKSKMSDFIFNAQTEIVILTDGKNLKDTNKAMLEFFRYRSVNDFHKEHDCICDFFEEGEGFLQKFDENGVIWIDNLIANIEHSAKVKMKDRDENMHIFKVSTSRMKIENNIYLITFSDITELLKKENMLISQSKKALMGEMIDAVAHQWKQPLNIIITNIINLEIKMEMNKISDELLKETTKAIKKQISHMNETIDEFRDFFRPHNKQEHVNITALIESVLFLINDDLIKNDIKVELTSEGQIETACVPNELKHVLINIINNAKDAFNDNGIKNRNIKINVSKNINESVIFIQDNAGGIPKEIISHIFEENFSTKKESNGTGIGLYMSKMIIEKSNGTLSVYNDKDGACFKITIP